MIKIRFSCRQIFLIVVLLIMLVCCIATYPTFGAEQQQVYLPIVFDQAVGMPLPTPAPTMAPGTNYPLPTPATPAPAMPGYCLSIGPAPTPTPTGEHCFIIATPSLNKWMTDIVVDVGAESEDWDIAHAWDYMDPEVETMEINPVFEYHAAPGYSLDYVNFYTIEDHAYHWWSGGGIDWTCIGSYCWQQGADWFKVKSSLDIDVFIIRLKEQ